MPSTIPFRSIVKFVFSYPAIVFWLSTWVVPSFFLSAILTALYHLPHYSPFFRPLSNLMSFHLSRSLIRIGTTVSSIAMVFAAVATHRFGTATLRTSKESHSFTQRTLLMGAVSAALSIVALLAVGWTREQTVASILYLGAALVSHACVDRMSKSTRWIGNIVN
jgi:hypothetical protein